MKALVKTATGPGGLELLDVARPVPERGQVLLAVRAAALCGTDVHIAHGAMTIRPPLILGHELAGVVAAVGPGAIGDLAVGQRVTTETDASFCGECTFCRAGDQHRCPKRAAIGTSAPGGLAEFVAVPAAGVHLLPDGVDFVAGALTEPLAVAVRAVVERGVIGLGKALSYRTLACSRQTRENDEHTDLSVQQGRDLLTRPNVVGDARNHRRGPRIGVAQALVRPRVVQYGTVGPMLGGSVFIRAAPSEGSPKAA